MNDSITATERSARTYAQFETHLKDKNLPLAQLAFLTLVTTKFGGGDTFTLNQAYLNATRAYAEHITGTELPADTTTPNSLLDSIENRSDLGQLAAKAIETSANNTAATIFIFRDFRRASLAQDNAMASNALVKIARDEFGGSLVNTSMALFQQQKGLMALNLNQS